MMGSQVIRWALRSSGWPVEIGDAHSILREYGNIAIREKEKIARVIE
jgi:hypothetical protein